jgi:hypothetical protein
LLRLLHDIPKHFQRVSTGDGNSTQQRCNKITNLFPASAGAATK